MKSVYLIANGDLRLSANQTCEAAQAEMEKKLASALERESAHVIRAHPFDPVKKHGFIDSQKRGIEVFRSIPKDVPLIVAEAVWEYSQHVLPGLFGHRGPILTVANWSGTWPGLVGLLNLNSCLTKAGVKYSTIWSENFDDPFFLSGIRSWLKDGTVAHDTSHVHPYLSSQVPRADESEGIACAQEIRGEKLIMGVFDEGCMGMYNAIIPDELLHPLGIFKERLSQSALYARMQTVEDQEARAIYDWLKKRGMKFHLGTHEETDLTEAQILKQCKMYIAALRMADEFGCATIGIQYQQGLKDLCPASDLAEGLLNNVDRPPAYHDETKKELFAGEALPHFNEVDECAGVDALVTNRVWRRLGYSPETTLHDLRWGRHFRGEGIDDFVWVLEISGSVPAAHLTGGYGGAVSERQPPMYFRLGGGTLKGISKPGSVVWSRMFIEDGKLKFDTGLAEAVKLPQEESEERLKLTSYEWPIMHAVLKGVTRDQMMARHKSNHIQVAYAPDVTAAKRALNAKAAAMNELGVEVSICGAV
ncbi:MAG TPA: fucose isomerase [Bacteroidota bacterium]|nr:fucose isomerase [Bacteroidota bacterium]